MLHFFPHYADDVSDHPFAVALRISGLPHRIFATAIDQRYTSVAGLIFGVYRRLVTTAVRSAVVSMVFSRPRPTAVVVGSDIEALIFGALRACLRLRTVVVLETLIIAPRRSAFVGAVSRLRFQLILALIDVAICHSRAEAGAYAKAFPRARCRFACVPYGTTVTNHRDLIAAYSPADGAGDIVSAGRSGRDYATLAKAIEGLDCRLRIICDMAEPVAGIGGTGQVTVMRDCFGPDYIVTLAKALFVIIPLADDDVSAGQMVLLQARALGKAVIVTRTSTTMEYASDGEDALLVEIGNEQQMRGAIRRLLEDPALRERIAGNALRRFEECDTTEHYIRNLVAAIGAPPLAPADGSGMQA